MFKLGQNTSKRLPSVILVSLLCAAVARISSMTVNNRSRFSRGNSAMSPAIVSIVVFDVLRIPAKLGIASVDSDGGLRSMGNPRLAPGDVGLALSSWFPDSAPPSAASKDDLRASVRRDCGTRF
jgi:hypothetical protein